MPGRFDKRNEVAVEDVERLMNCIVEHARPDQGREAERLLAMLTMLRATATGRGEETIVFTPPRGTGGIVDRALAAMARSDRHAARAERHRRRPPSPPSSRGRGRVGGAPRTAR